MTSQVDELELSQLVDGELDNDRANTVLLSALDDARGLNRLRALLELRQGLASWRGQSPRRSCAMLPAAPAARLSRSWRSASGLAAAAVLGGMLVAGGFLLADRTGRDVRAPFQRLRWAGAAIPSDDVRHAANVFALHESVAGPLAWFAADDRNIQFELEERRENGGAPVAVFLTLSSADGNAAAKTDYVIVCRSEERASVRFTALPDGLPRFDMTLTPTPRGDAIDVRYVIRLDCAAGPPSAWASLAGQRALDATQKPLGQVILDGNPVLVSAGACRLPTERNG